MFYSLVHVQTYEQYIYELMMYNRKTREECQHSFFKDFGTSQVVSVVDHILLPEAPSGYMFIPIPENSGMCVKYKLG
jgi:hypothetical protein